MGKAREQHHLAKSQQESHRRANILIEQLMKAKL